MRNLILIFLFLGLGIAGLRAQCPAPCPATVVYTTTDGAFLDWCDVPGVDSFRVVIIDTLTNTEYGPFYTDTSQFLATGLPPGTYWVDICSVCPGPTLGCPTTRAVISVIIIVDEVVLRPANPPTTSPGTNQGWTLAALAIAITPNGTPSCGPPKNQIRLQVRKKASGNSPEITVADFDVRSCANNYNVQYKAVSTNSQYTLSIVNKEIVLTLNGGSGQSGTVVFKVTATQKDTVSGNTNLNLQKLIQDYQVRIAYY